MKTLLMEETDISGELINRRFFDELYLLDMTCDCEVVGARASHSRLRLGDRPLEELSDDERSIVESHLLNYGSRPYLTELGGSAVLLIPSLAASGSLGIMMKTDIDGCLFLKLARYCGFETEVSEDILKRPLGRLGKLGREKSGIIHSISEELERGFGEIREKDIADRIRKRAEGMSYLTGAPIGLKLSEKLDDCGPFDEDLLCAGLLLFLLLARRVSRTRGLDVWIENKERLGLTVSAEIVSDTEPDDLMPEIITLKSIAYRKNVFFDFSINDGEINISFSPSVKEWSYLELKAPDEFDWDK